MSQQQLRKKRWQVICRLKGGLGNQLFQYACTLAVANQFDADMAFDASILTPQDAIGRKLEIKQIFGDKVAIDQVHPRMPTVQSENPVVFWQEVAEHFAGGSPVVVLDGYFQQEDFFMRVAAEVKSDLAEFRLTRMNNVLLPKQRSYTVGLHLRRHDYQHLGLCVDSYYEEAIQWFSRKYAGDVQFYVFTDEPLYTTNLLSPLTGQAQIAIVNTGQHIEDFLLMSSCDHFVIANSTYSWWAAYLGETKHSIVFAPYAPWVVGSDIDPLPARWCKVANVVARNYSSCNAKESIRWARFSASYSQFQYASSQVADRLVLRADPTQLFPCMDDEVQNHPIEPHYLYHPAWAIRKLIEYRVTEHFDFGSTLNFATMASAIAKVTLHDFRPPNIHLSGLQCKSCDLTKLDYPDDALPSISCMHTIEHIGLGRYGDDLNPLGDQIAASELARVLQPNGLLFFVVPVGRPRMQFNAHRIYSFGQVRALFPSLQLLEHSLIPDNAVDTGMSDHASAEVIDQQTHGCGCFIFRKQEL